MTSGVDMVVDTSVVLSVLFDEPSAAWAVERLEERAPELRMSTVNLAETLILLRDRQPQLFEELDGYGNPIWCGPARRGPCSNDASQRRLSHA